MNDLSSKLNMPTFMTDNILFSYILTFSFSVFVKFPAYAWTDLIKTIAKKLIVKVYRATF